MSKTLRSPLFLMALTVFIDITGFGFVIPLLPFWAERLGANAVGVGLAVTVYALAQFLFTPVLGSLSDRYGRRPIIILSLVIEMVGFALTALSWSLLILLVARFVGGLGASNIGSAQAVVVDVTTPEERTRGMGLIGAAIGLGFVVGPALGGLLAPLGATIPFWAAMGVALVNTLLVFRFLPETRKRETTSMHTSSALSVLSLGWRQVVHSSSIVRLVSINLLFTVAFSAMETTLPLFTQHVFGWAAVQNGYLFTYVGVIVVIMQGGLIGQLVKRFGEKRMLTAGLLILAVGLALLAWSQLLALLFIALGLLSIGEGAVTPIISSLLSLASSGETQGETLGFAQGAAGLGRILGPLLGGGVFAVGSASIPFFMGAGLVMVSLMLALPALAVAHRVPTKPLASREQKKDEQPLVLAERH